MDTRNVKVPCDPECPNRNPSCHTTCEKYAEYTRKLSEQRKKKYTKSHADEYLADYRKKRRHKDTLEKKRKGASLS